MSGAVSYHAGFAAEHSVAGLFLGKGAEILEHRWRGKGGEIDLIARDAQGLVFVEVKKSRDIARAAQSLGARQIRRLYDAASEYLATLPQGLNTPCRFDVALVDAQGRTEIIENALCA
jgi:putative endonuclease